MSSTNTEWGHSHLGVGSYKKVAGKGTVDVDSSRVSGVWR